MILMCLGKAYQERLLDSSIYYIMEARKVWELVDISMVTSNYLLMAETYLASGSEYYRYNFWDALSRSGY